MYSGPCDWCKTNVDTVDCFYDNVSHSISTCFVFKYLSLQSNP